MNNQPMITTSKLMLMISTIILLRVCVQVEVIGMKN